jgi:hypothetical protein
LAVVPHELGSVTVRDIDPFVVSLAAPSSPAGSGDSAFGFTPHPSTSGYLSTMVTNANLLDRYKAGAKVIDESLHTSGDLDEHSGRRLRAHAAAWKRNVVGVAFGKGVVPNNVPKTKICPRGMCYTAAHRSCKSMFDQINSFIVKLGRSGLPKLVRISVSRGDVSTDILVMLIHMFEANTDTLIAASVAAVLLDRVQEFSEGNRIALMFKRVGWIKSRFGSKPIRQAWVKFRVGVRSSS